MKLTRKIKLFFDGNPVAKYLGGWVLLFFLLMLIFSVLKDLEVY